MTKAGQGINTKLMNALAYPIFVQRGNDVIEFIPHNETTDVFNLFSDGQLYDQQHQTITIGNIYDPSTKITNCLDPQSYTQYQSIPVDSNGNWAICVKLTLSTSGCNLNLIQIAQMSTPLDYMNQSASKFVSVHPTKPVVPNTASVPNLTIKRNLTSTCFKNAEEKLGQTCQSIGQHYDNQDYLNCENQQFQWCQTTDYINTQIVNDYKTAIRSSSNANKTTNTASGKYHALNLGLKIASNGLQYSFYGLTALEGWKNGNDC
eukprot:Awhi_evm1s7439